MFRGWRRMSKQTEKMLVPKLRFPEFWGAGGWEGKPLEEVTKYENGKAHEKDIDKTGDFIVVNSKFISTGGEVKKFTNTAFCIAEKEDILMVLSDVPNGRAIAKCFFVDADNLYTVNQRICKLTPNKVVSILLFYSLNRNSYFLAFDDGVKQTNLRKDDVLNCPILLPKAPEEQQKIADCLSSIDELITAHRQKHETLKAHKKGLMQQLFPAEGEAVPKLRFPEFRDAGEWDVKTLDQLTSRIGDGIHSTPKYNANGNYYFINGNNLVDGKISISGSTKRVNEVEAKNHSRDLSNRTILLSINGTIGNLAFYNSEKIILGKSAAYINLKNNIDLCFIYNTLKTFKTHSFFVSELTGSTIKNLSLKTIRETKILIPTPSEQQKIANCLSSIDELITAQAQKIESLKAHKKGLMQQLFPSVDEVNG